MKKLFFYIKTFIVIVAVVFLIIVSVAKTIETIPDNAIVLVSDKTKLIYSPVFFSDYRIKWDSLRVCTYREAKNMKYKANKRVKDEGYFINEQGSIIWGWLDDAGILKQRSRWNKDGSWNW